MEIDAAKAVARHLRVRAHRVIDLDLSFLDEDTSSIDDGRRTKGFYFPARNTIFLSLALA